MKILFCSPNPFDSKLGAARVLLGVSEELTRLGWACTLVGPSDLGLRVRGPSEDPLGYADALKAYLKAQADAYDIVEYDHGHLPFARSEFPLRPLFVARSVLLAHHFLVTPVPISGRRLLYYWLRGDDPLKETNEVVDRAHKTLEQADLIHVSNSEDVRVLAEMGIASDKIMMLPFGLGESLHRTLMAQKPHFSKTPKIISIGTFDRRKGAADLPKLFEDLRVQIPGVSFRLLGTGRTSENVKNAFSHSVQKVLEVIPTYDEKELPQWVEDGTLGVFPSYIEGFGIGAAEMMAAGLPVVAYRSPGPLDFVPEEWLVQRGNWEDMSLRVMSLSHAPALWEQAHREVRQKALAFRWSQIAEATARQYTDAIARRSHAHKK